MKLRRVTKAVSKTMVFTLCTQLLMSSVLMPVRAASMAELIKPQEAEFNTKTDTDMTDLQSEDLTDYDAEVDKDTKTDNKSQEETMLKLNEAINTDISSIDIVRGNSYVIPAPNDFEKPVTWTTIFKNADGKPIKNVGFKKKKYELKTGDVDGNRTEGIAKTDHIVSIKGTDEGGMVSGHEKGVAYVIATDSKGKTKEWKVNVLYTEKGKLPTVSPEDYKKLIQKWSAQLVGENPDENDAAIMETVKSLNEQAKGIWDRYSYKGQLECNGIPWPDEEGKKGNPKIEYKRDAVEFRQAFKNVLVMAKAYRVKHGMLYKNQDLFKDMINILDWLTANCYRPQSQTDNWWTWEIGIPKDIIPALILLSDELTMEQKIKFTEGVRFFQPDPFHGGAIGTGSTHGQGYRMQYAANRVDCSMTALGIGLLLEDNESVYLASLASSSVLGFVSVTDSTTLAEKGYPSGYYKDGSYIDHICVPYAGSYGIVVLEGIVNISAILSNSPWQFSQDKAKILEDIFVNTYGIGVYNGLMLDTLRGRAVAREKLTDKTIGRQVMNHIIKSLDSVGEEGRKILLNYLKNWLTADAEYVGSLKELNEIVIKKKAQEIIENQGISGIVPSAHKNYPLMDRAIHRTDNWLFALSMFSERISNAEIMNGENLYGWHQGDGVTYLYGKDTAYYNDNYWNTINPFRLPGTTTVSKNIGNGKKDSSGFYQEGDYNSKEAWVGGSELSGYGVNGMSLSGDCGTKTTYEPNLRALKSYFMFDDEVVCLGTGINDSGSNFITETTVENRKLNADASNQITLNGNKYELPTVPVNVAEIVNGNGLGTGNASMEGNAIENAKWLHVEGNAAGDAVGFYFPKESGQLKARKVASTGNWGNINLNSSTDVVKNYFELWFDHGKDPQNAEYSYVMLPGKTVEEMKAYEKNPTVEILANTADVQAVSYKSKNVIGANFWQDKVVSVGGITCDKKASIIMKQTGDTLEIGVSDPTMKNLGTIEVEIDRKYANVVRADSNVKVDDTKEKIHLSVNTNQKNGDTSYAVLSLKSATDPTVPAVPSPSQTPNDEKDKKDNTEKTVTENIDKDKKQSTTSEITKTKDENNNDVLSEEETLKDLNTGKVLEARKKVVVTDAKTGEQVEAKLIKDGSGKLVDASVYTTGIASKNKINKKTAAFTVQIAKESIQSAAKMAMKGESGDIVFNLGLNIPTESYLAELEQSVDIKKVKLDLILPQDFEKESNVSISNIQMKKEDLKAIVNKSAGLSLSVQNEKNEMLYSWDMDGKKLKESQNKLADINFALKTVEVKDSQLKSMIKDKKGAVVSFAHHGDLPAAATVKINDGDKFNYAKSKKLYVYYYNEKENKLEETYYDTGKALKKGVIEFKIAHCSDYVVLPKKLDKKLVVSLMEQVFVTSKLKLKTGEKQRIIVKAADGAKITYKSSNPKIATVYRGGVVKGKSEGEAVITVTVKIKGKTSEFKVKVRVKK